MSTDIQFASTLNNKYYDGAKALLVSLKRHNPCISLLYNFLVFDNIDNNKKEDLKKIYSNINFIQIPEQDYNYYNTSDEWRNWEFNCYNRFEIFNIKCEKLIFLDLDMIIMQNIEELLAFKGAFGSVLINEKNRLDHPSKNVFDGGLMIIDSKFLNKTTKEDLIKISKSKKWTSDEPVLNLYFEQYLEILPKKYNILSYEYEQYKNDCAILQYVGAKKPWMGKEVCESFDEYIIKNNKPTTLKKMQRLFYEYCN